MDALGFSLVAACAALSALLVVRSANLIHAVLWLGVTLVATAALYAMLGASFLAGVQVLVYVGGVITLMVFGLMITRRHEGIIVRAEQANAFRAGAAAIGLFGLLALAISSTRDLDAGPVAPAVTTGELGRALLGEHVLAFEVMSFLLLGAIIGAIVIARRHDPGADTGRLAAKSPPPAAGRSEVAS